jgi:hypothetical protein
MRILVQLQATLNLEGADIYPPDVEDMCKRLISDRYVGRNYKSCHVLEVVRILRRSPIRMTAMMDGSASIDVQFEARAVKLFPGEVLHECKVIEIDEFGAIRFVLPNAAATMDYKDYAKFLKIGDVIPTRVHQVSYMPFQTEISLTVTPFAPVVTRNVTYKVVDAPEDPHHVDFTALNEVEALLKEVDPKTVKAFKAIMYPFKKKRKHGKPINLKDIASLASEYVVIGPEADAFTLAAPQGAVIGSSATNIQSVAAFEARMYLEALYGLCRVYPTSKEANKCINVWKYYANKRQ